MRLRHLVSILFGLLPVLAATSAEAGGPITSGTTVAGTLAGPTFTEAWTFSGTTGQAVLIGAVTTTGLVNTNIVLKAPGGAIVVNTSADRAEFQLTANGTYTIEISDLGLNDAGNYAIGFLNLTAGPLTSAGDLNGGPIVSSDVLSGTASGASDFDAYTFSGTLGQRVLVTGMATAGAGYNTNIVLYPPGGGLQAAQTFAGDQLDFQLTATGTWTIVIEDNGLDTPGSFNVSLLNVTAGPYTNGSDPDGGTIASNDTKTGTFQTVGDMDAWTYTGAASQVAVVVAAITGAGTHNTNVMLYPPNGAAAVINTSNDRNEATMTVAGTWTIVVSELGLNDTGTYGLGYLNATVGPFTNAGDLNGGPIVSGEVKTGTASGVGDFDGYTFSGTAGQRVLISGVATAGAGYNTNVVLYPPAGGLQATQSFAGDLVDFQLTATGTWTIVMEDNGLDTPGSFNVSLLNVTAGPYTSGSDPDGGTIASNDTKTGTFQVVGDMDAWTYTGAANQLALVVAAITGAGTHNTNVWLYPPGGGPAVINTSNDRNEATMNLAGTWTIVVADLGLDDTGTYGLGYLNATAGPFTNAGDLNGGPIVSSDVLSGTASGVGDFDGYTFSGTAGQRVLISGLATAGATYNTNIVLYPPNGGLQATQSFAGDLIDFQLTATGTWTIVMEDNGLDTPGSFNVSLLNVTAGPYTNGSDPDGGTIASNDTKTGTFQVVGDMDAWTYTGAANQLALVVAAITGAGTHNTNVWLYPPGGGPAVINTSNDRNEATMNLAGTWTIVVADFGLNDTGTYGLGYLNVTAGPFTNAGDLNGGPIVSSEVKTGTASGVGDFDGYTFSGTVGQRVLISGLATAGAGYNTNLVLYPPNGGLQATQSFAGDLIDFQLTATGTWTVVMEDNGVDTPGSFSLQFLNVTAGPYTSGADPDGGTIASNDTKAGTFQTVGDMDAWTYTGAANQLALVVAAITGAGTHNTNVWLYPPGGGPAVINTSNDRNEATMNVPGTWTIVVADFGLDDTGTYGLGYLNVTAGPFTNAGDLNGGPIVSSEVKTGTASGVGDFDGYTFSGTVGQRVLISGLATAGATYNTNLVLYPPNGGLQATQSFAGDLIDFQLTATGTWTVVMEDNGVDTPGSFSLQFLNVTAGPYTTGSDPDGGTIVSSDTKAGTFQTVGDMDAWTYTGAANQLALVVAAITGAGTHNTNVWLYPPNGGPAVINTSNDRNEATMNLAGTWTIVVADFGLNDTGTYGLGYLNVTVGPFTNAGDLNGGPIVSNEVKTGTASGVGDFDGYRFTAVANDRVIVTALATGGAGYNTNVVLYPPNGGLQVAQSFAGDRLEFKLTTAGAWTIVVEDNGVDTPGNYSLGFLNASSGPMDTNGDVGVVQPGTPVNAAMNQVADIDGYAFYGVNGEMANITATTLTGTMNTQILLYPPNGDAPIVNTTTDNFVQALTVTGLYHIVIEDSGDDEVGTYRLTLTGAGGTVGVPEVPVEIPDGRRALLLPAAPNPFRQGTLLAFYLRHETPVRLRVYDATGALVRTLVDERLSPGRHDASWDGRDQRGGFVASGMYYLRLSADGEEMRQKLVRIR